MTTDKKAANEYRRLIRNAKNKDAALSAFDRNHYKGEYGPPNGELGRAIAAKFAAIRNERFQRRHRQDIGKVTGPTEIQFATLDQAVKKCEEVLQFPESHKWPVVLACLLLATGRRTAEVVGHTQFTLKWFRGTVKSDSVVMHRANYLVPFRHINNGLRYLEANGMRNLTPPQANTKCGVPLHRTVANLFPFAEKAHDLRAVHVAYLRYMTEHRADVMKMASKERHEYLATVINEQLAHNNILSALPYLKFKIR